MHAVRRVDLIAPVSLNYYSTPRKFEEVVYLLDQAAARGGFKYHLVRGFGNRRYGFRMRLLVSAHKKEAALRALVGVTQVQRKFTF